MSRSSRSKQLTPIGIVVALLVSIAGYILSQNGIDLAQYTSPSVDAPVDAPAGPTVTEEPGIAGQSGNFDYYVLSLSWSPDYCASNGSQDPQQCGIGKRLGFVLHGLWPEYEKGYPSDCSTQKLSAATKARFPGLYPSDQLYAHEWEKHGTCSGLNPEEYLALSKRIRDSVNIPAAYRAPDQSLRVTTAQVKKEFVAANPGLSEPAIAVYCSGSGKYLTELYVCLTPDGKPRACSNDVQSRAARSCQSADFLMRNTR